MSNVELQVTALEITGRLVAEGREAVCAGVRLPGGVLMLHCYGSAHPWMLDVIVSAVCYAAIAEGMKTAVAFTVPNTGHDEMLLTAAQFRRLTSLVYLRGTIPVAGGEPPRTRSFASVADVIGDEETKVVFSEVIGRTYRGSADCPEMALARSPREALEAHQSAGFDPALWHLLYEDDQHPVGCCLFAPAPVGLDLVYLGLEPSARGKQLGTRALLAVATNKRVSCSVDSRNVAGLRFYDRLGLRQTAVRHLFTRSLVKD